MNQLDKDLLNELADYLVENNHWRRKSFPVFTGGALTVNLAELSETGRTLVLKALAAWSEISGLVFEPVERGAHIHFSESDSLDLRTAAFARVSSQGHTLTRAEITIAGNPIEANEISVDEHIFRTLLHEIGHALGLYHPFPYPSPDVAPTRYGIHNNFTNDSWQATVMSYFSQYDNTDLDADYAVSVTPMSADILAIHELYGAPTIRTGDTVYGGINSNVGGHLGAVLTDLTGGNLDNPVTLTIIDHGGYDIIDFSSHDENNPGYIRTMVDETTYRKEPGIIGQRVNLNPGWASDVYNVKGALVIAHGAVIEGYYAGAGDDHVTGNMADNRLDGGPGNDTLLGGPGDDYLEGRSGADTLDGGPGADTLDGGSGNDTVSYFYSDSGVAVNLNDNTTAGGEAGGDTLRNIEGLTGSVFDDILIGNSADNLLSGEAGNDQLDGAPGNDILDGGAGADRLDGGPGTDWLSYAGSDGPVSVRLYDGYAARGHAEGDTISGFENLRGSAHADALTGDGSANRLDGGAGADRLEGGSGDDVLEGGPGADRLGGGSGDDVLEGGPGADRLDGGAGSDTAVYRHSGAAVTVNLEAGAGAGGHAEGDELADVENVEGSAYDDTLTGSGAANRLAGAGGDDVLEGGAGADRLDGGPGTDWLSYAGSDGPVSVRLYDGYTGRGHAEGDTISGFENLRGSDYPDALAGSGRANRLDGGAGADRLGGGSGDDVLEGGAGADRLDGGPGTDWLSYQGSDGPVSVRLYDGYTGRGHAEGDTISGFENLRGSDYADALAGSGGANRLEGGGGDDRIRGAGGDDVLEGGPGADRLGGGSGDDVLEGGPGADRLDGGAGADRLYGDGLSGGDVDIFIFGAGHGDDIILDFNDDEDQIDLTAFNLSGFDELAISTIPDGVKIDLTGQGGGAILLQNFDMADLDATDFLF